MQLECRSLKLRQPMQKDYNKPSAPPAGRYEAYTTDRPDVFALVPATARDILDVGCSNGALGSSLKSAQPGRTVCGIEFDALFAQAAARQLDGVIHADLNLLDWSAALAGRRFDCIVFADVLEHLVYPQHCLRQAIGHLQPGGCIVLSLPNIRHICALRSLFVHGRFPQRDRGIFDRTHLRWFTLADAKTLIGDAGLQVSAMSQALRWGDQGGGTMNRWLNRVPPTIRRWAPVREFLTYQFCLRAQSSS